MSTGDASLDGGVAFTTSEFNYYIASSNTPMEDEVLTCPFDKPECLAQNKANGAMKGFDCHIYDGRADAGLCGDELDHPTFDKRGLFFTSHESQVSDFWDEEQILAVHYPEMAALAKRLTGCDIAATAAHALRGDAKEHQAARNAAFTVHNDFSDTMRDQFLRMHEKGSSTVVSSSLETGGLGVTDEQLRSGRLAVINFWRPIQATPLSRNPLAVLDASTIGDDDVVLCRHPAKDENFSFIQHYRLPVPFINTLIRPNPSHKWFYFPAMTRGEVMVFKNYDSCGLMPHNGVGMHSSFEHPDTPPNTPPRESIEIRVACFWHGGE
ncbi:hypothetical protein B484DRAFT_445224 [Ochromonadaceae sp. CCMP2298]|nr:hypothetical protein B484DRAFT_445224 [Ochromonadaceae sp. CCMP2298]|mmetsp:Transcript_33053/g.72798  ORF Transcript_33053/g.72798 Transcript_33053/m.72798 type:complete len:324 (+) Transcript_33053:82-1053(+)